MLSGEKHNVTFLAVMRPKRSEMVALFALYAGTNFYVNWYGFCEEIMIFWICGLIFLHFPTVTNDSNQLQKQLNKGT